jgi:hypothetical protein
VLEAVLVTLEPADAKFLRLAYEEAKIGYGRWLSDRQRARRRRRLIARGRNRRVQRVTPSPTAKWIAYGGRADKNLAAK